MGMLKHNRPWHFPSHKEDACQLSDRGFQQLLLNSRGLHIGAGLPGESRG